MMQETYDEKIKKTNLLEELDNIKHEILKEWPNTMGSYFMFKKVKDREKELYGRTEHN
jgi:hypothetical protein